MMSIINYKYDYTHTHTRSIGSSMSIIIMVQGNRNIDGDEKYLQQTASFCRCWSGFEVSNEEQDSVKNPHLAIVSTCKLLSTCAICGSWTCGSIICSWTQMSLNLSLVDQEIVISFPYDLQPPAMQFQLMNQHTTYRLQPSQTHACSLTIQHDHTDLELHIHLSMFLNHWVHKTWLALFPIFLWIGWTRDHFPKQRPSTSCTLENQPTFSHSYYLTYQLFF